MARVLIGIPTTEFYYPDCIDALWSMDKGGNEVLLRHERGYTVDVARNRTVRKALELGVDYLLMVDNDVVLPNDALVNLMSHDVDVCLGFYAHRPPGNEYSGKCCLCKPGESDYKSMFTGEDMAQFRERGEYLVPVHGGGMGCALIKTSLLRRLPKPWFKWVTYTSGSSLSEDLYFCEICRKNNVHIYADSRVKCGHIFRYQQQLA